MTDIPNCSYRSNDINGKLYCGLAKDILKSEDDSLYYISDKTCIACAAEGLPKSTKQINKIVAMKLATAAQTIINVGGVDDCSKDKAEKLINHIKKSFPGCKCSGGKNLKRNLGRNRKRLR